MRQYHSEVTFLLAISWNYNLLALKSLSSEVKV